MKQSFLGVGLVVGLLVVIIGVAVWWDTSKKANFEKMTPREVALTCTTDMATEFHIHPVLKIMANGENIPIPADIGITPTCMNSLHTHDATGTLHVEAPVKKDFVLGDFFAVWHKPFTKAQVLDFKADDTHTITVTVNGTVVETYENTPLNDLDQVVISYEAS